MSDQQLTKDKGYLIAQGLRPEEVVARVISVRRSTVYRELRRNGHGLSYEPTKAHELVHLYMLRGRLER